MTRHHKGVHLKIKDQVCNICNMGFYLKETLRDHVNNVHKDVDQVPETNNEPIKS